MGVFKSVYDWFFVVCVHCMWASIASTTFFLMVNTLQKIHGIQISRDEGLVWIASGMVFVIALKLFVTQRLSSR